uniref:DUF7378 domain-containing protein n=1 Tax=Oryza punctata TaxID=4537 RepID=A0A0E0JNE9_ORYPU
MLRLPSSPPPRPTTIGEAYPDGRRFETLKWIAMLLLVSCMFAGGLYTLTPLISKDPLYLARVPWRLPVRVLRDTYLSLTMVIRAYTFLYLPRAPLVADEYFFMFGLCAIGGVAIVATSFILGLPVEDERVVIACAGILVVLVAALLAYCAWLVRMYGRSGIGACVRIVSVFQITHRLTLYEGNEQAA